LAFEGTTTFGDAPGTVQVGALGSLGLFNSTTGTGKTLDFQGGRLITIDGAGTGNVVNAPVLLSGDLTADLATGTTVALRGVISGAGSLNKDNAGILELSGTGA